MADQQITFIDALGVLTPLVCQLDMRVLLGPIGLDMPPIGLIEEETPFQAGSRLRAVRVKAREVDLPLLVKGAGADAVRAAVRTLLRTLDPTRGNGRLRVTGPGGTTRELTCRYIGGAEGAEGRDQSGLSWRKAVLTFKAFDPYWYDTTLTTPALTTATGVANANYIIGRVSGLWGALSTGLTGGDESFGLCFDATGNLYITGTFLDVGDANGDGIVKWNGAAFSSLTTGLNDRGRAVAIDSSGILYVAGDFTLAGGVANTKGIAKWNGAAWSAMGTGCGGASPYARAIAVGQDGSIYVGGMFASMGGVANTLGIAKWDGTVWSALGTGMDETVTGLAIGPDGSLYAVGFFTLAGGVANTVGVAKWNGTVWSALGTGLGGVDPTAYSVAVGPDGTVYVTGKFTSAGGVACSYVAKWNGSAWSALGTGLSDFGFFIGVDAAGLVHVGGQFTAAGGLGLANRYAIWNGTTWTHAGVMLPGAAIVGGMAISSTKLYLAFSTAGTAQGAGQTIVTNPGSAPAYPILTITRPAGTVSWLQYLRNETTGQTLYLNYNLLAGETLTIALTPGAKVITSNYFGNVIGRALLPNSDFATFCLQPGANVISLFVFTDSGTASLSYYAPHLGC